MTDRELHERRTRVYEQLAAEPWAHDFFAVLRQIESLSPESPRLGKALRPGAEPIRLGQDPELDFAPAAIMSFKAEGTRPRLGARFFGLFGPMGPLPLHITEYARDRLRNHADPTFARFADVFHHRALLLFYRAWAQSQPTVQADRPHDDQFAKWVSALIGQAPASMRSADSVADAAKRHSSGLLAKGTRNPEAIAKVLRQYFDVPIRVEPYVGHWMALRTEDRSRLGRPGHRRSAPLGVSAVAGAKVWDRQYKLRLHIGPLTLAQYEQFLPGQPSLLELRDWMRQLVGFELLWDVRLVLKGREVPRLGMQGRARLGRTTWLGRKTPHPDRGELFLNPADISLRGDLGSVRAEVASVRAEVASVRAEPVEAPFPRGTSTSPVLSPVEGSARTDFVHRSGSVQLESGLRSNSVRTEPGSSPG